MNRQTFVKFVACAVPLLGMIWILDRAGDAKAATGELPGWFVGGIAATWIFLLGGSLTYWLWHRD